MFPDGAVGPHERVHSWHNGPEEIQARMNAMLSDSYSPTARRYTRRLPRTNHLAIVPDTLLLFHDLVTTRQRKPPWHGDQGGEVIFGESKIDSRLARDCCLRLCNID
jgi:hypothetical protein